MEGTIEQELHFIAALFPLHITAWAFSRGTAEIQKLSRGKVSVKTSPLWIYSVYRGAHGA